MPEGAVETQSCSVASASEAETGRSSERCTLDEEVLAPSPRSGSPTVFGALGLLFASIGFLIGSRAISDNSFFTHFATGRIILADHSVPTVDPYSATAAGEPWTVQSWLVSLTYASLNEYVGEWGIRLFHGILTAAVVALVWKLLRPIESVLLRVVVIAVPLIIGTETWTPRPHLVGLLGLVIVMDFLINDRNPAWLLPIMWIWVNSHGSFPLSGVLIGTYGVGRWLDDKEFPVRSARVMGWTVAGILLGAVGPLGWRAVWFPVRLLANSEALDGVTEWSSPGFDSVFEILFGGLILVAVALGARRSTWTFAVPTMVFMASGLLAIRNIAAASVIMVVMAAPLLANIRGGIDGSSGGLVARSLGVVAIAVFGLSGLLVASEGALVLEGYPVEEIAWLSERDLVANSDVNLVERETIGNLLELKFGVDANVFMDDRFDMYPMDVQKDHTDLIFGRRVREILESREAEVILWENDSTLRYFLDEIDEWVVVNEGDDWFVACNVSSEVFSVCNQ